MSVRGSLEHPPIVIRSVWWKIILHFSAVAALVGVFFDVKEQNAKASDDVAMFIVVFVFVFCGGMLLHAFLRARIEISPAGISFFTLTRKMTCSWAEVTGIHLALIWSPHVLTTCIRLREEPTPTSKGAKTKSATLLQEIPGSGWPMSAQELADLLNSARRRWSGVPHPHEEILGVPLPDVG
jgi:hypothetical protein